MIKRIVLAMSVIGLGVTNMQAQELGFSIGGHVPNPAAILDIQATNKGVMIPRLTLTENTVLEGGSNPTGVIVYNNGTTLTPGFYYWNGTKWELLTGDSYVTDQLTLLEQKWEEQINSIINGGSGEGTDISYLVSFNPETNKYSYLKPKDGGGYEQIELDITAVETNTFFKTETQKINVGTENEKDLIVAYIYFSEDVIKAWRIANPTAPIDTIDNGLGTKIDVLGIATEGFGDIVKNETNLKILQEIIQTTPNNVWIEVKEGVGEFLVYYDSNNQKQEINLTQHETQTYISKHVAAGDGIVGTPQSAETLVVGDLKQGDIYYSYVGEHDKIFYINMTEDVITSVQNSELLKKEIFNTINNYSTTGGNVFYGKMDASSTEDVLYIIKDDQPQQIDITQDILKVIEDVTNNTIIEKLLERTEIHVVTGEMTKLNEYVDGYAVYKAKYKANVKNYSDAARYNTNFERGFDIPNLKTLLGVKILKGAELVQNSVTSVEYTAGVLNFKFGLANMCSTLLSGEYQVIIEYVSTELKKEDKK